MDNYTSRYNHIEDVLTQMHRGSWFGWSDSKNKVYDNLIIHDKIWDRSYTGNIHEEGMIDNPHSKPTKEFLESELQKIQDEFDAQEYARNRATEYPSTGDQLDMMYKDNKNSTTTHAAAVEAVKTKWPKDNSGPI